MELESAVELLYSDESLTGGVDDATAKPLLKWAESQLPALIADHPDDESFENAFALLRRLVKWLGRLIDERKDLDEDQQSEWLGKIQKLAQKLGVDVETALNTDLSAQSGPAIIAQVLNDPSAPFAAMNLPAEDDIVPVRDTPVIAESSHDGDDTPPTVDPLLDGAYTAHAETGEEPDAAVPAPPNHARLHTSDEDAHAAAYGLRAHASADESRQTDVISDESADAPPSAAAEEIIEHQPAAEDEPAAEESTESAEDTPPASGFQSFFRRITDVFRPASTDSDDSKE